MKKTCLIIFACFCILYAFFCYNVKRKSVSYSKEPLVSVIIPAYNHENYVEETLLSIINQTYKNIELIIIDDGSSDETFKVIQNVVNRYPNRFIRVDISTQKNAGTTITLNRLKEKIKGDFVYPIASDDVAYSDAIEKEVNFLLIHPDYVLVACDNRFIDDNSNVVHVDFDMNIVRPSEKKVSFSTFAQHLRVKDILSNKGLYSLGLFGDYFQLLRHGNHVPNGFLLRQNAFDKIAFTSKAPLEDYFMMLQLSKMGKFGYIDEVLFSYRRHTKNTASKANAEKMNNMANKTLEYEKYLCFHEPFDREYSFKVNLYKLKCKLKYLIK